MTSADAGAAMAINPIAAVAINAAGKYLILCTS
jgi:hypothetical protein